MREAVKSTITPFRAPRRGRERFLVGTLKLPDDHVMAVGYGKTQPKNPAAPFAGENRRVQITKAETK